MVHNGEVNSRFKVRSASARCSHVFWLFTVSSGVAPQCECTSRHPQRSSMNATCLTGALPPRISVLLCQVAWTSFVHLDSCSFLAVAVDEGSGMKFKPCTGASFHHRRRRGRHPNI